MRLTMLLICAAATLLVQAQSTFINPILPGGHPDPSICRVGDDYYIVNSTFEYFPGLPIHHSTDLVNWELIGYGIHRPEQGTGIVNLVDVQQNGGIHAPSIRYHDGLFYIIVTNVYSALPGKEHPLMVNFIITAEDPAGPWSDPVWVEGAPGIDPDLFWDDDGKVYFVGTRSIDQPDENGIGEIWVQELDPESWQLRGERHPIWRGACGGCCVEGPHIYKENGLYYVLVAEGGTGPNHAVMMAASDKLFGPYESNPRNPVITSRHLSRNNWVNNTGHADLVQLADGRWYMVALGIRNEISGRSNMGRETHLMPVIWEPVTMRWEEVSEGNWQPVEYVFPVVSPETGRVERHTPLPFEDHSQRYNDAFSDNFQSPELNLEWNWRRIPVEGGHSLSDRPGYLRLQTVPQTFELRKRFNAIGFRQKESDFSYRAAMEFKPKKSGSEAGISIFQQDNNFMNLTVVREGKSHLLKLTVQEREQEIKVLKSVELEDYEGSIQFRLDSHSGQYHFSYSLDGVNWMNVQQTADDIVLCYGYIGTCIGLYATGNGVDTGDFADFDWVEYKGFVR